MAVKEQAFKPTIALAVFAGFLMGYWSYLSEASYTTITIRTGVTMAALGLLSWLFIKVMDGAPLARPSGKSMDLAELMGAGQSVNYAVEVASEDDYDEPLDEEDAMSPALEPLGATVARI